MLGRPGDQATRRPGQADHRQRQDQQTYPQPISIPCSRSRSWPTWRISAGPGQQAQGNKSGSTGPSQQTRVSTDQVPVDSGSIQDTWVSGNHAHQKHRGTAAACSGGHKVSRPSGQQRCTTRPSSAAFEVAARIAAFIEISIEADIEGQAIRTQATRRPSSKCRSSKCRSGRLPDGAGQGPGLSQWGIHALFGAEPRR